MRPARLSMRLGVTVSAICAIVVLIMVALAYTTLSRQLDSRAEQAVNEKLNQIEHSLTRESSTQAGMALQLHNLRDQIIGHDNYTLNIYDSSPARKQLMTLGAEESRQLPVPGSDDQGEAIIYLSRPGANEVLMTYRQVRLANNEQVLVQLALDRKSDEQLLTAYIKSTLSTAPLILLLVGGGAWWGVHRELKPLLAFRKIAAKVSAHELSHRMAVEGLPDELRDLAHAINFMLQRLDDDVQKLARFSDDLSHELRSPINNLMGKAQVTLSRERPATEYKQALESCTEELERLSKMVSQMLFLASASQPCVTLTREPIDLRNEAEKVIELFSSSAEEKSLSFVLSGHAQIHGDRLMIQRAISNLLSNAINHGLGGSTINLDITHEDSFVVLAIQNTGEGIAPGHLPRVFDRFYRVCPSQARQQGGTGLGLAIVQSIMSLHVGRAVVHSELGGLTTFKLMLPVAV